MWIRNVGATLSRLTSFDVSILRSPSQWPLRIWASSNSVRARRHPAMRPWLSNQSLGPDTCQTVRCPAFRRWPIARETKPMTRDVPVASTRAAGHGCFPCAVYGALCTCQPHLTPPKILTMPFPAAFLIPVSCARNTSAMNNADTVPFALVASRGWS